MVAGLSSVPGWYCLKRNHQLLRSDREIAAAKGRLFGEPVGPAPGFQAIRTLYGLCTTTMGVMFSRRSIVSSLHRYT